MAEEKLPQENVQEKVGDTEPQPKTEELGAEKQPQEKKEVKEPPKPERTYSQEEWSKRESEKDEENATLRRGLNETMMRLQIFESSHAEKEASAKDKEAVTQGLMSQEEADRREQVRLREVQLVRAGLQLRAEQEEVAKNKVAREIAKRYGVSADDLLNDKDIKTPTDMVERAFSLAQQKQSEKFDKLEAELKALKEGTPKFDKGQSGSTESTDEERLKARYPTMHKK